MNVFLLVWCAVTAADDDDDDDGDNDDYDDDRMSLNAQLVGQLVWP